MRRNVKEAEKEFRNEGVKDDALNDCLATKQL